MKVPFHFSMGTFIYIEDAVLGGCESDCGQTTDVKPVDESICDTEDATTEVEISEGR